MTTFEIASLANAAAAVLAAVGIWFGIRAMVRANDERGKQQSAATQQQRAAEERRHEENMTALKALIAGLERQIAAPETVAERTAPADGARTKGT